MMPERRIVLDTCMVCGNELPRDARWGPTWLVSRYCSAECSERRLGPLDYLLEEAIPSMLAEKSARRILRLSHVARAVDPLAWETLMERTRNAAQRLAARGELVLEGSETGNAPLFGDDLRLRLPN
jgi:hypothetical protein